MLKKGFLAIPVSLVIFLTGCTSNEVRTNKRFNADAIYFDYNIWGDEESGMVTVKLQFRVGGPGGASVVLDGTAKVEFDGEELRADSSRMNGAWYEMRKAVKDFGTRHQVVYTDNNEKQYQEEFNFNVFYLSTGLPKQLKRDDLVFEFEGLEPGNPIKVLLTDTSFFGRGIDRLDTVRNSRISVTRQDLDNLKNGPVSLEFYLEEEKALLQTTRLGGRLSTSYGLRRVFELKD
jgi:hypothetical protein